MISAQKDTCGDLDFQSSRNSAIEIIDTIVEKAEGVFLWVVTNELVCQIRKNSDVKVLRRLVRKLPLVLEAYFHTLIYDRIPKHASNLSETASVLKLALIMHDKVSEFECQRAGRTLEVVVSGMELLRPKSICNYWLLQMVYLDEGRTRTDLTPTVYSTLEAVQMVTETRMWLAETCKDLLVLNPRGE